MAVDIKRRLLTASLYIVYVVLSMLYFPLFIVLAIGIPLLSIHEFN